MGKKRMLRLLGAVLAMILLAGCSRQNYAGESTTQIEKETITITEEILSGESTLVIDTTVEVPDLTALEEITLCFDEELLDTMVEELVHTQYPGLEEHPMDGDRRWSVETEERLLFSLGITDEGWESGRTYYLDVLRDLNGQHMGEDALNIFTPYYMTEHIPDKLEMTSQEAAETMDAFLSQYSCFTYKPWSVSAVTCRKEADASGYYQMWMQPQFEGMPVYGHGALQVSACMSAEGVFTFQGIMVLKEQYRKNADASMTLEEAMDQFKSDFSDDPQGSRVTVDHIKAGYLAESHYSGAWTLSPAWIFEYNAVRPRPDNQEDATYHYTCAYRMKNGSLYTF